MGTNSVTRNLKAGDVYDTDSGSCCHLIVSGRVMISVFPIERDKKRRGLYLCELGNQDQFPGLNYEEGDTAWRFAVTALTDAVLTASDDPQELDAAKNSFLSKASVKDANRIGFEEAMAEKYRLNMVKDNAYFYQTIKDKKGILNKGLQLISSLFEPKKRWAIIDEPSKSNLYNAIRFACRKEHIEIADYSDIVASLGVGFSIEDVARLSDFLVRRVTLDDDWYRKNVGVFVAFRSDNRDAVVCHPRSSRRYLVTDLVSGTEQVVTMEIANGLLDYGYVLARPFSAKPLSYRDVIRFVGRSLNWKDLLAYFIMMLLGTVIGYLLPEATRIIYDDYVPSGNLSASIQIGGFVICLILSNLFFTLVKETAMIRIFHPVKQRLEAAVFHRLFNLPVSFFREYDSGDLAGRAIGASAIWSMVSQVAFVNVVTFAMAFIYLFRMVGYSSALTSMAILMLLCFILLRSLLVWMQVAREKKRADLNAKTTSIFYQYLEGLEKIRLSGSEDSAFYRYLRPYVQMKKLQYQSDRISMYLSLLSMASVTLFTLAFFVIIGKQVQGVSPGVYIAFSAAFGGFSAAVMSMTEAIHSLIKLKPELKRAKPLLDTPPESEGAMKSLTDVNGEIELSNVSFSYDSQKAPTINNINLHIRPGEYIGIVGPSGSGKSTLMKLLLGFEKPTEGQVLFSGRDLNTLNKRELRKRFGIVLQNGKLLPGSILENITITSPGKTLWEAQDAVEAVGLKADIEQMPMGLHTMVSEDAGTISGGQKQRILIARALINKPSILLMDEPTSALDNITQQLVADTMEALPVTRIVIAHRLSTVKNCDRIIVLKDGVICEEGSYEDLLQREGVFYQLASRQVQ